MLCAAFIAACRILAFVSACTELTAVPAFMPGPEPVNQLSSTLKIPGGKGRRKVFLRDNIDEL